MKKKFKFSVIIPIYNTGEYLEETIDSILSQTIGFEKNIQLILINDGSVDNSEEICLKYKELYFDNIIYVKQKNSGVSIARNKGIELATGEFVTFLDSDDLWSEDSFEIIYKEHKKNPTIKLLTARMNYFEFKSGNHPLNYKYNETKIVDIFEDIKYIQLSASSAFFALDIVKNRNFDSSIKFSEDTKFVNEILLDIKKMMVVKGPIYKYRWRGTETSAIQNQKKNISWYLDTPKYVYEYLFNLSKKKYGKVIDYLQYLVMYDLKWRIKDYEQNSVNKSITPDYLRHIKLLLKEIDKDIIFSHDSLFPTLKCYIMGLKYNANLFEINKVENGILYLDEEEFYDIKTHRVTISVLNYKNGCLDITGKINWIFNNKAKLYINIDGKRESVKLNNISTKPIYSLDSSLYGDKCFRINKKIKENSNIYFELKFDNDYYQMLMYFTVNGRLHDDYTLHYDVEDISIYNRNNKLYFKKHNLFRNIYLDILFLYKLLIAKKFKAIIYRTFGKFYGLFIKKKIWLISDRTTVANDNGMHLFKYICNQKNKNINPYFVISKESADYKELKKYGKVVNFDSFKYKILFLNSNKIISSQADNWVINAFGRSERFYRDMYRFDFVFLQHGITKDNQTAWLNYMNKNIKMLVTAAENEYKSFLELDYGYNKDVVKLTGFPRYDNLKNEPEKLIAVMPTWRTYLAGKNNAKTGIREYNNLFKNTIYYKFYNDLINDKEILNEMKEHNVKGIFVVHPSHINNACDFNGNNNFTIIDGYADYQDIFKRASLLISDYSSVPFDFAYLNKPILYTQFDKEEFFGKHLYTEGYFSYEKDGFGPVVYNYDDAKKEIIRIIKSNFEEKAVYKDRIKKFYKYQDKNNCKRVYNDIINMDRKE